jgi:hypothetical protein
MRIFDIEIYRDGGSLEFRIEKNGVTRHVWLETPLKGEPRALLINSSPVGRGSSEVEELLTDIAAWWSELPPSKQALTQDVMQRRGPHYNPSAEISEAIDLSRVLHVREYVQETYGA